MLSSCSDNPKTLANRSRFFFKTAYSKIFLGALLSSALTPCIHAENLNRSNWSLSANTETNLINAIDGQTSTRWTTGQPQSPGQYIEIDFGSVEFINNVTLDSNVSPDDYPRSYDVYTSLDGSNWGDAIASGSGGSTTNINFDAVDARFLRVEQNGSDVFFWWSIHEINVNEAPAEPMELNSSEWTLSASTTNSTNVNNAIDGNPSTRWTTFGEFQRNGQYFEIDLGSQQSFDQIILDSTASELDYPRSYEVYVSNTGFGSGLGNPITSGQGSADGNTVINFDTQNGRYIRIVQTGSVSDKWWSIHELRIFNGGSNETTVGNVGNGSEDDDNDGVINANDVCPNTPAGTSVDSTGCPVNSTVLVGSGSILVFTKTAGFSHASIPAGETMLQELSESNGWEIEITDDASVFTDNNLAQFQAVVWLNTTGDVLNDAQQDAFEDYIEAGGGYVGIHSAADTEYDWPWYGDLVGAYFLNHPEEQTANVDVEDGSHPSTSHLDDTWNHFDEWYNYQMNPRTNVNVVLSLDEDSYNPGSGAMGDHPISWYHNVGSGRSFYTGLGHGDATYSLSDFRQHIEGAISWAGNLAEGVPAWVSAPPVASDFETVTLAEGLNLPVVMDISRNGDIYAIGRAGAFYAYENGDTVEKSLIETRYFGFREEGGLIGFVLDPNFINNRYAYFHYTHPSDERNIVTRMQINANNTLNFNSEVEVLSYDVQTDECCHMAGDLEFDNSGNLYISTGDNTNPFSSNGFAPIDERSGRSDYDAQKSSSNTNDLRGKILRITPQANGSYSIPAGNLFAEDAQHRGEIYIMGNRNPYRMTIDSATQMLYWGDIGPDSNSENANRGPTGYDELNRASSPGNYGWPYFSGDNEAYNEYNFANSTSGAKYNAASPINNSPNNTGATMLPGAQASWVKMSHRATMVGDVYRWDSSIVDEYKLPSYFHGRLIYWNFNNDSIIEVDVNESAPESLREWMRVSELSGVIDAKVSPFNNRLYLLGYGNNCCGSTPGQGGILEVRYVAEPTTISDSNYAINAGGGRFTSSRNVEFNADALYDLGQAYTDNKAIAGTQDDDIYTSHHWNTGEFAYNFPISNGDYVVELMFAEIFYERAGDRVFSVDIEGERVLNNLDVVAQAGANTAYDQSFSTRVLDGSLQVVFSPNVENPMISGIRIFPKSYGEIGSQLSISSESNGLYFRAAPNGGFFANGTAVANDTTIEIREGLNGGIALYSVSLDRYLSITNTDSGGLNFNANTVGLNESFRIEENGSSFSIISLANERYLQITGTQGGITANAMGISDTGRLNIAASEPCNLSEAGDHGIDCRPIAKAYLNFPRTANADLSNLPLTLSETGAFSNVADMVPNDSLIPYEMLQPLWSDRAKKSRWVAIPSGTNVEYFESEKWNWPAGTVFVKTFELPLDEQNPSILQRLETRFIIVMEGGEVYGATYKWRADNSDADLLFEGLDEMHVITNESGDWIQTWSYPSPADCVECHNSDAGGVLGPKTASINGNLAYPSGVNDNQLSTWNHLKLFDFAIDEADLSSLPRHAAIEDESASLELRVRSYWDSNCAYCHGPRGIAALWDARFNIPLEDQGVVNGEISDQRDYFADYGLNNPLIVDPGNPDNSILYIRDNSEDIDDRMPPIGRNLRDDAYISVLERWIDSLN